MINKNGSMLFIPGMIKNEVKVKFQNKCLMCKETFSTARPINSTNVICKKCKERMKYREGKE